jgi:hypothetical protein
MTCHCLPPERTPVAPARRRRRAYKDSTAKANIPHPASASLTHASDWFAPHLYFPRTPLFPHTPLSHRIRHGPAFFLVHLASRALRRCRQLRRACSGSRDQRTPRRGRGPPLPCRRDVRRAEGFRTAAAGDQAHDDQVCRCGCAHRGWCVACAACRRPTVPPPSAVAAPDRPPRMCSTRSLPPSPLTLMITGTCRARRTQR